MTFSPIVDQNALKKAKTNPSGLGARSPPLSQTKHLISSYENATSKVINCSIDNQLGILTPHQGQRLETGAKRRLTC